MFILLLHVWIKKLKPLRRKAKLEAFTHLHRVIDIDDKFSGLSLRAAPVCLLSGAKMREKLLVQLQYAG